MSRCVRTRASRGALTNMARAPLWSLCRLIRVDSSDQSGSLGAPLRHGSQEVFSMSVIRSERNTVELTPMSEVEGEIREFVRRDVSSFRRFPEAGGEVFVSNLNSIVQRVAGTSVAEIDNLITELEQLRAHLHLEGQRVQREVVAYAQMSQAAMRSTKIIVESMSHFKHIDDGDRLS